MKTNHDIRKYAEEHAVLLWQIADELGIADATLSRWLRKELPPDKKRQIFDIIDRTAEEQKEGNACS